MLQGVKTYRDWRVVVSSLSSCPVPDGVELEIRLSFETFVIILGLKIALQQGDPRYMYSKYVALPKYKSSTLAIETRIQVFGESAETDQYYAL